MMGDWNVTPETLDESGWVTSIGGAFVDSGRPSCLQGDAARNYDYCVVSSHWVHRPTASLYEAWAPGPHTAVLFEVPWDQPRVMVEVVRKPKTFPERQPFGPFKLDVKDCSQRGYDLKAMPVPLCVISSAAGCMYEEIES